MTGERSNISERRYARFDGLNIVLTTENGVGVTNTIVIEPHTLLNFELWLKRLREMPQPQLS